jgi:hypothetical protein
MRRIVLICAALIASLAMTISASARLGMAPLNAEDGSLIQIKGGHGHGHGHHGHRGGRGHHYGWAEGVVIITDGTEAVVTVTGRSFCKAAGS